ncbi:AraC family transcriptional regulator [Maricaulis sp.]|uniref:helix-turn-helix domain-containing protein n=1 Tax=Maricaulis sp. TaxID=1486257 RepID=UPI002602A04A|nr:AraC family transcriptional regulator [Maricaulis sp.]
MATTCQTQSYLAGQAIHSLAAYQAWGAPQSLTHLVDRVWAQEGLPHPGPPQFLLPHAEPSLCLLQTGASARLVLCGPARTPRVSALAPDQRLFGITLRPEIAAALSGIHPNDCIDRMETPDRRLTRGLAGLTDRIATLETRTGLELYLQGFARLAIDIIETVDPAPEVEAAHRIRQYRGQVRLGRLGEDLGLSPRQLRRRFIDRLGISPKRYAREHRLAAAIGEADAGLRPDWAAIAAGAGYCDQAHLISETRDLTGLTPVELHARRRGMSEISNTSA